MKETRAHAVRVLHLTIGDKAVGLFKVMGEWNGLLDVQHVNNSNLQGIIVDPFPNGVAADVEKMLKLFAGKVEEDPGQVIKRIKLSPALLDKVLPDKPGPTPDAGPWPWVVHTAWPYAYHNPAPPATPKVCTECGGPGHWPLPCLQWSTLPADVLAELRDIREIDVQMEFRNSARGTMVDREPVGVHVRHVPTDSEAAHWGDSTRYANWVAALKLLRKSVDAARMANDAAHSMGGDRNAD